MIRFSPLNLAYLALLSASTATLAGAPDTTRAPLATASAIHYRDGKVTVHIENKPLIEVLRDLGAATGARLALSDPGRGQEPVSAVFDAQPFLAGVKKILEGFSYAIYTTDGQELRAVIVLSTPRVGRSGEISGTSRQLHGGEQTAGTPSVRVTPSATSSPEAEARDESYQAEARAREQAEREETVNYAIAALSRKDGPLSQQALDQLVGIRDDPRATQALVQTASEARDSRSRVRATQALRHHAADLQFADEASISALEQLATDADVAVQETARQALADMKQYREANAVQSAESL